MFKFVQVTKAHGAAMPGIIEKAKLDLIGQRIRKAGVSPKAYAGSGASPEEAEVLCLGNGTNVFAQVDDEGNGGAYFEVCTKEEDKLVPHAKLKLRSVEDNTIVEVGYCEGVDYDCWQCVGPYLKTSSGVYLVPLGRKGHAIVYYENTKTSGGLCTPMPQQEAH